MTASQSSVLWHIYPEFIFALGGFDGEKVLDDIVQYDSRTNNWSLLGKMSTARSAHAMSLVPANVKQYCTAQSGKWVAKHAIHVRFMEWNRYRYLTSYIQDWKDVMLYFMLYVFNTLMFLNAIKSTLSILLRSGFNLHPCSMTLSPVYMSSICSLEHCLTHGTSIIWLKVSIIFDFNTISRNFVDIFRGRGVDWAAASLGRNSALVRHQTRATHIISPH